MKDKNNRPAPGRRCGGCIECCIALGVAAMDAPEGTKCREAKSGVGCKIYHSPERPKDPCDVYRCGWLIGFGKNADRPDKSGVIFNQHSHPRHGFNILTAHETRRGAAGKRRIQAYLDSAQARGYVTIIIDATGVRTVRGGPPKAMELIRTDLMFRQARGNQR